MTTCPPFRLTRKKFIFSILIDAQRTRTFPSMSADTFAILEQCNLFTGLESSELKLIGEDATEETVPDGHVFFEVGDTGGTIYLVVDGAVRVARHGTEHDMELAQLGPGTVFGEMSFLDGNKTTAKISAVRPTVVLRINSESLHGILNAQPGIAAKFWRNYSTLLKGRLDATNELVEHYFDTVEVLRENPSAAAMLGQ